MSAVDEAGAARRRVGFALLAGAMFGAGLAISGMTDPGKVIGFLDVAGKWDPSLAFVMGGAIAVFAPLSYLVRRRAKPLAADKFELPTRKDIDLRLVGGAAVFGVGWGMAGYCPGPAIVTAGSGSVGGVVAVLGMLVGMLLYSVVASRLAHRAPAAQSDG